MKLFAKAPARLHEVGGNMFLAKAIWCLAAILLLAVPLAAQTTGSLSGTDHRSNRWRAARGQYRRDPYLDRHDLRGGQRCSGPLCHPERPRGRSVHHHRHAGGIQRAQARRNLREPGRGSRRRLPAGDPDGRRDDHRQRGGQSHHQSEPHRRLAPTSTARRWRHCRAWDGASTISRA